MSRRVVFLQVRPAAAFAENMGPLVRNEYWGFENKDVVEEQIRHDEGHDEEHEEGHGEMDTLANSDVSTTSHRVGLSTVGDWGYVGMSYSDLSSTYGIPFHSEAAHDDHGDEHGDEHAEGDHDEDHDGDEHHDEEAHHDEHGAYVKCSLPRAARL